jgi:hypothetical protein
MISNLPHSLTALSTAAFTSSSLPTSAFTARAPMFGHLSEMMSTTLRAVSMLMSTSRTWAPSCAKRTDDSRPMPLLTDIVILIEDLALARG